MNMSAFCVDALRASSVSPRTLIPRTGPSGPGRLRSAAIVMRFVAANSYQPSLITMAADLSLPGPEGPVRGISVRGDTLEALRASTQNADIFISDYGIQIASSNWWLSGITVPGFPPLMEPPVPSDRATVVAIDRKELMSRAKGQNEFHIVDDNMEVTVNGDYLYQMLSAMVGKEIEVVFDSPKRNVQLRSKDMKEWTILLAPMLKSRTPAST